MDMKKAFGCIVSDTVDLVGFMSAHIQIGQILAKISLESFIFMINFQSENLVPIVLYLPSPTSIGYSNSLYAGKGGIEGRIHFVINLQVPNAKAPWNVRS